MEDPNKNYTARVLQQAINDVSEFLDYLTEVESIEIPQWAQEKILGYIDFYRQKENLETEKAS